MSQKCENYDQKFNAIQSFFSIQRLIIKSKMYMSSLLVWMSTIILNTNEPTYTVEKKIDNFEIRNYDSWVVAETRVKGTFENAGNDAFHVLAGYIFGKNDQNVKIEMTAPVTQQQIAEGEFLVQFYMPKEWTLNTLPKPNDPRVNLRQLPSRRVLAERYNGGWSIEHYNQQLKNLNQELVNLNLKSKGEPIWARYNSPMAPSFLRTNEIIYELV